MYWTAASVGLNSFTRNAALIDFFRWTMDQMTLCHVKVVTCSDNPTWNYYSRQTKLAASWRTKQRD